MDDKDVYGQPLCELGKHVLGPSGTVRVYRSSKTLFDNPRQVVKLSFEKRRTGERYVRLFSLLLVMTRGALQVTHLVRGKGVLTVM